MLLLFPLLLMPIWKLSCYFKVFRPLKNFSSVCTHITLSQIHEDSICHLHCISNTQLVTVLTVFSWSVFDTPFMKLTCYSHTAYQNTCENFIFRAGKWHNTMDAALWVVPFLFLNGTDYTDCSSLAIILSSILFLWDYTLWFPELDLQFSIFLLVSFHTWCFTILQDTNISSGLFNCRRFLPY